MTSRIIIAAAAATALLGMAATASAAPGGALVGAGEALKSEAASSTLTDSVAWRRSCWWGPHGRVCRWVRSGPVYYGYYAPRPFYGYSFSYGGYRGGYRRHWR
jgi:hypothetical protein